MRQSIHGKFLSLKELYGQIAVSTRSRPVTVAPSQDEAPLPRSGFVHEAQSCHRWEINTIGEWLHQFLESTRGNRCVTHWRITIMLVAEDVSKPLFYCVFFLHQDQITLPASFRMASATPRPVEFHWPTRAQEKP